MRTAVVDIGTNSTRLLIADIQDGRVMSEVLRTTTVTRLGAGVDASGRLDPDAIARVERTLGEYARQIDAHHAQRRLAVLTSAVRDAANGPEFARRIETKYALTTHLIPGDEEARLSYLGATSDRDRTDTRPTLVLDIGGGSTEFVIGRGADVEFSVSTQAGVVRQTERHFRDDPPTPAQQHAMRIEVRAIVKQAIPHDARASVEHTIAVAGTPTSLAAIAQQLDPYDPAKVHGYVITAKTINELHDQLARQPLEQRRETKGLHPDRAPTIVAGTIILTEVLSLFDLSNVEVSENDILRGAALGL